MNVKFLESISLVIHDTVVSAMAEHISNMLLEMLPFCYVAIPLIYLSLFYEKKKDKYNYEHGLTTVHWTILRSFKKAVQKIFNYVSWIFLSVSASSAFNAEFIAVGIMVFIYGLEAFSLLNIYAEGKGVNIDEVGMLKIVVKFVWSRITGNFEQNFDDVIKKHEESNKEEKAVANQG